MGDCSYSVYLLHVLVLYAGWLVSERCITGWIARVRGG